MVKHPIMINEENSWAGAASFGSLGDSRHKPKLAEVGQKTQG